MKVVIIVLILVVIGFVVAIGMAVYRATTPPAPPSAHGPPTKSNGEIDDDALASWEPPPMAAIMGRLSRPFAPKLLKTPVEISGQAGSGLEADKPGQLAVAPADKAMRIARLRLVAGRAAIATYHCVAGKGETCDQVVCLCPQDAVVAADDAEACGDPWRKARSIGDDKLRCRKNDDDVSAVIYRTGGAISVVPMGGETATVSIR
ncbi:hypothetical protein [Caulobacter soli]|uniref:hypothetical protein n=1 Tax=Caulobacter soli TaxID=2708539 RepID=UPI0013EA2709|nr:hypothetical protein [Caulobacter soli]